MKTQLKQQQIRGLQTAWLQSGSSTQPILLLLHGYPDGPEIWDGLEAKFNEQFQVIRPYGRGTSHSAPSPDLRRYGTHAEVLDLFAILREVDPKQSRKVVVVGHDLGGILAWALAGQLENQLGGLVVFNSLSLQQAIVKLKNPRQLFRSWYVGLLQIPRMGQFVGTFLGRQLHHYAYTLGGLSTNLQPDRASISRNATHAANRYRALLREGIASSRAPAIRVKQPVLVVCGNRDPFVLPPTIDEVESQAVSPEIRILEAGHWPFLEQPASIHSLLVRFFAKLKLDAPNRSTPAVQTFLSTDCYR